MENLLKNRGVQIGLGVVALLIIGYFTNWFGLGKKEISSTGTGGVPDYLTDRINDNGEIPVGDEGEPSFGRMASPISSGISSGSISGNMNASETTIFKNLTDSITLIESSNDSQEVKQRQAVFLADIAKQRLKDIGSSITLSGGVSPNAKFTCNSTATYTCEPFRILFVKFCRCLTNANAVSRMSPVKQLMPTTISEQRILNQLDVSIASIMAKNSSNSIRVIKSKEVFIDAQNKLRNMGSNIVISYGGTNAKIVCNSTAYYTCNKVQLIVVAWCACRSNFE